MFSLQLYQAVLYLPRTNTYRGAQPLACQDWEARTRRTWSESNLQGWGQYPVLTRIEGKASLILPAPSRRARTNESGPNGRNGRCTDGCTAAANGQRAGLCSYTSWPTWFVAAGFLFTCVCFLCYPTAHDGIAHIFAARRLCLIQSSLFDVAHRSHDKMFTH